MDDPQIETEKQNNDSSEDGAIEEVGFIEEREGIAPDLHARLEKVKFALKRCEQEKREYLDGWQRAKADHINYRKDEGKRFEDMARFVISGVVSDILPVLDSFDLAIMHGVSPEIDPVRSQVSQTPADSTKSDRTSNGVEKGILLIKSQLYDILKKRGLELIGVKQGDAFDPAYHEALEQVEVSEKEKDGVVLEELQKGYMIHDRVLRPAKVKVGIYKNNE